MGYNYSKGLVLTLRDSSTGSPWSPGSCSLPLSATWFNHHVQTALKKIMVFSGSMWQQNAENCANGISPTPFTQKKILSSFFFTLVIKDEGVFNEFCRAGCASAVYDAGHDNRVAPDAAQPLPADSKQLFALVDIN